MHPNTLTKTLRRAALLAAGLSFNAYAALPASADAGGAALPMVAASSPASQLTTLQAQIPVLKAQAEIAKLKEQIAHPSGSGQSGGPAGSFGPGAGNPKPSFGAVAPREQYPVRHKPEPQTPTVLSITGYNGHLQAIVNIAGQRHIVAPGQQIDGWVVHQITSATVQFEHRGRIVSLRP